MTPRARLGDFGERVASHHLEAAGMTILVRKLRLPSGEIDIVARDREDIVLVEVRTRRGMNGAASESITATKLARMWRCAFEYAEANTVSIEQIRLDLLAIELKPGGQVGEVIHLRALEALE